MGQHQNKIELNQQFFQSVYVETISNDYFSKTKGFGFRKANIRLPTTPQKISQFLQNGQQSLEQHRPNQKIIMKKQFETSAYPYSCIGLLIISYKERCKVGTGCLIGPNLVLTAASNVYHKDNDEHPQVIRFVLSLNQGQGDAYRIKKNINVPERFIEETTGSHRYNYALLQIERKQPLHGQKQQQKDDQANSSSRNPGLTYGYLGINTKFSGLENIYIYGCSIEFSDKNELRCNIRGQKIDKLLCKNGSIGYKMESSQTEGGSPILIRRNQYFHIVGIHICGKKDLGSGVQVDENMRKALNSWISIKQGRMDLSQKGIDWKSLSLLNWVDWTNLTMLNLDNNNLVCSGLVILTKGCWPVLRELHVCNNRIVKLQFESSSIINLQVFYLSKNYIKQIIMISELAVLRVLELSDNRVEEISDLLHLKYLERLYLNGNKLDKVPAQIEKLADLKKLELSRNSLENIPRQILKLNYLSVISLDQNASNFDKSEIVKQLQAKNVEIILD